NAEQLQLASVKLRTSAVLFEQEAVKAVAASEAWVAGSFPCFNTPEEGLKREVHLMHNTLCDLAEHLLCIRHHPAVVLRQYFKLSFGDGALLEFPCVATFGQRHVVEVTT